MRGRVGRTASPDLRSLLPDLFRGERGVPGAERGDVRCVTWDVGLDQELGHAAHVRFAPAAANPGNLGSMTSGGAALCRGAEPPGELAAGADAELGVDVGQVRL